MSNFGKGWNKPPFMGEVKSKDQIDNDRKYQESLDNLIRQTIGQEPYSSLSGRSGEKPVQCLYWPDTFEQQFPGKTAKGLKLEVGLDMKENGSEEIHGTNGLRDSGFGGLKAGMRGLSGKAVVAFAQAAAKVNDTGLGWPLLSSSKLQKCDKCLKEYFSSVNYRRHIRGHRRSLHANKENLSKERENVAAFWNKLSPEEADQILSMKNIVIENLSGDVVVKNLAACIQQTGLTFFTHPYYQAGGPLLDIVQKKASTFPTTAEKLISLLDDASERTFLCGGTSKTVQRFVYQGDATKLGVEDRNLVASLAFFIEHKLVNAWIVSKDAEALVCQKALVEEEEAAKKRKEKLMERKRSKKLRQKEMREKERRVFGTNEHGDDLEDSGCSPDIDVECDSPTGTGSSSSTQNLHDNQSLECTESFEINMADVKVLNEDEDNKDKGLNVQMQDRSITAKNHEYEKPLYQRKNGRLNWERNRQEYDALKIKNLGKDEDSISKLARRFSNGTKFDQWVDHASFFRFQQYRNKNQRSSRTSYSVGNGHVVWARKHQPANVSESISVSGPEKSPLPIEQKTGGEMDVLFPCPSIEPSKAGSEVANATFAPADILPEHMLLAELNDLHGEISETGCAHESDVEDALFVGSLKVPIGNFAFEMHFGKASSQRTGSSQQVEPSHDVAAVMNVEAKMNGVSDLAEQDKGVESDNCTTKHVCGSNPSNRKVWKAVGIVGESRAIGGSEPSDEDGSVLDVEEPAEQKRNENEKPSSACLSKELSSHADLMVERHEDDDISSVETIKSFLSQRWAAAKCIGEALSAESVFENGQGMTDAMFLERMHAIVQEVNTSNTSSEEDFHDEVSEAQKSFKCAAEFSDPVANCGQDKRPELKNGSYKITRHDRWQRTPKDRFPEQRYLPRRQPSI